MSKAIRQVFVFALFVCLLLSQEAQAIRNTIPSNWFNRWNWLLAIGADVGFPESHADRLPDVEYGRRFNLPTFFNVSLGARPYAPIYLGVRYQYWLTEQDYTLNFNQIINRFHYQGIGGEVGLMLHASASTFAMLSGTVYAPIEVRMSQRGTGHTFKRDPKPLTYEMRLQLAWRMSRKICFIFSAGYRFADFGNLTANEVPFLPPGKDFNMSDAFIGASIGYTFDSMDILPLPSFGSGSSRQLYRKK